jgi:SLBB domain
LGDGLIRDEGDMPPLPQSLRDPFDPVAPPGGVEAGKAKAVVPFGPAAAKEGAGARDPLHIDVNLLLPAREPRPVVARAEAPVAAGSGGGRYVYEDPADSSRVYVVVSAFNTKVYYVQGDVGSPGRLPWTGNETVMDALTFSGGFLHSADRNNIRLNRPARGDKPAKSYKIDYDAIERGEKKANLQLFPGDRLIIERKAGLERRV